MPEAENRNRAHVSIMLNVVNYFKDYQFNPIAGYNKFTKEAYQMAIDMGLNVVFNQIYALMNKCTCRHYKIRNLNFRKCLFRLPQVVCYKGG